MRKHYGPMRPSSHFSFLRLVRVPESRVSRGRGFLGGGEVYSGQGGVRKGVVFRNLGLFGQRCSI